MAQIATPHAVATAPTTAPKLTPKPEKKLTPVQSLIAGGIAGATEACITYPFEYAKTRSQLKSTPGLAGTTTTTSSNPFALLTHTIKTEGVASLYTGCGALALGTALKAGVRFLTFDTIKAHLTDPATGTLSKTNGDKNRTN
ncbi:hypothetical protein BST61_g9490 [Cercospora zeina]